MSMVCIGFTSCDLLAGLTGSQMVMDKTEFSLPAEGGQIELKFIPTSAWSATCSEDFISFSPASGDSLLVEVAVIVTVEKNEGEERVATLMLSFETNDIAITITQAGVPVDNPSTPDTPDNPDTPDTPDNPENPDTPDNPDAPDNPKDDGLSTEDVIPGDNIETKTTK